MLLLENTGDIIILMKNANKKGKIEFALSFLYRKEKNIMLYIMSIVVSAIIIFSVLDFILGTEMMDMKSVSLILLGFAIAIWFTPSENESGSKAGAEAKAQQEKILNLCRQNPVTKMYEDKGNKYVVINNGVYAVTGEYWGYYTLNEKCK